jgi:cyclin-dependent kinase
MDQLLRLETRGVLAPKNMIQSQDINSAMRSVLVDWLITAVQYLNLNQEQFHPCIRIVDGYLAREPNINRNRLQLLGITSLFMVCKYSQVDPPWIGEFIQVTDNAYGSGEIVEMEQQIFEVMGCNINVPNDAEYLNAINRASDASKHEMVMSRNLIAIYAIFGSEFLPSVIASAVAKIICQIYTKKFTNYFQVPANVIDLCVNDLVKKTIVLSKSKLKVYLRLKPEEEWLQVFRLICESKHNKNKVRLPAYASDYLCLTYYKPNLRLRLVDSAAVPEPLERLGEGTYGVVDKIEYEGKLYAVKKIKEEVGFDGISSEVLREISITLSLKHHGIIAIRHITSDFTSIFLDLGTSDLYEFIAERGGTQDIQLTLANQLLSGLLYLHDMGFMHRDIKPNNVIVYDRRDSETRFVLGDFGSARPCENALLNGAFTPNLGTLQFRAPEILLGNYIYNAEVDVWSMMCTLYYAGAYKVFLGDTEIDQLSKIFQVLGSPTQETWPEYLELYGGPARPGESEDLNNASNLPTYQPIENFFYDNLDLIDCYKELLTEGFVVNPAHRPTAKHLVELVKRYM